MNMAVGAASSAWKRRLSLTALVPGRCALRANGTLADEMIAEEVRARLRHSSRTNVSRAVSDLVRAGLVRRHY
jgi:Arc/MetJ family transcription regulator